MATHGPNLSSRSLSAEEPTGVTKSNVQRILETLQKATSHQGGLPTERWLSMIVQLKGELERLESQAKEKAHHLQIFKGVHKVLLAACQDDIFGKLDKGDQSYIQDFQHWCEQNHNQESAFSELQKRTEEMIGKFYHVQSYSFTPLLFSDVKGNFFYYLNRDLKVQLNKPFESNGFDENFPAFVDLLKFNKVTPPEQKPLPQVADKNETNDFALELQKRRGQLRKVKPATVIEQNGLLQQLKEVQPKAWDNPLDIEQRIRQYRAESQPLEESTIYTQAGRAIESRRHFLADSDNESEADECNADWDMESKAYTPVKDAQASQVSCDASSDDGAEVLEHQFKALAI